MKYPDDCPGYSRIEALIRTYLRKPVSLNYSEDLSKPPLLQGLVESDYEMLFRLLYCRQMLATATCHLVRFRIYDFAHAFFGRSKGAKRKDFFDIRRAQRLLWIWAVLTDPSAEIRQGYVKPDRYTPHERVFFWPDVNYLAVVRLMNGSEGRFVTAYPLTGRNAVHAGEKILNSPRP